MIFSTWFEIGLLVLGGLYIADMFLDSIINLIQVSRDIDEDDKNKAKDEELKELTKHLYS
jgi:hypothetical protein